MRSSFGRYHSGVSLLAPLLRAVEAHTCFTGCYHQHSAIHVCVDPAAGPELMFEANCQDCLTFHIGALVRLLPPGMTEQGLARALTQHMRQYRGYVWSTGGYHARGPGFWLNAVCCAPGLFLVDGSRNRNGWTDVEALIAWFRTGLVQPSDPSLLDPAQYESETVHVDASGVVGAIRTKDELLQSGFITRSPKRGHQRVSVIEFLPIRDGVAEAADGEGDQELELEIGDICPRCGAAWMERPLFSGTFIGCLC